jgi:hypothetical protein
MAHSIAGNKAKANVGGSQLAGKLLGWEHRYMAEQADDTGGGDLFRSRIPTFVDWEADIEVEIPASGYTSQYALLNAASAIALFVQSTDVTPFFAGTGLCTNISAPLRTQDNSIVTQRFTFKGDGTTPVTP